MGNLDEFEVKRPLSFDNAWCSGCGNFPLRDILGFSLRKLNFKPTEVAIVSGIGQAAKIVHYFNAHGFHTLHGRAIPIATGLKVANPELVVIAEGGDGDMYSEGGNHFISGIRRNSNITVIIHNNQIYGLTKGQGSPTTMLGQHTTTQPFGLSEEPLNTIAMAIALNASFVSRVYVGNKEHSIEVLTKAIEHKGFSIVEFYQPCVSFNKVNTYQWYAQHTYIMSDHNPTDKTLALKRALEEDCYPLGIFYINEKPAFEENLLAYKNNKKPLCQRGVQKENIEKFLREY